MSDNNKILIIDDERINLEFFEVMLTRLGFEVTLADNGDAGLQKVVEVHPDLILLDNIMPGITGWEITKLLKQSEKYSEYKDIPIIMFSDMDEVKDKVEGFELGIDDYIIKPFNFSEVLARIRAVLRHNALISQISHRERRMSITESLNKSLVYFTEHLKKPVTDLITDAEMLDHNDVEAVKKFKESVILECKTTISTIAGLEDEITQLKSEEEELKKSELSIEDLDNHFEKHFKKWNERNSKVLN
ncbi:MAG: response regulator transcription factor [Spirochaetaceae bacterium]|nr:response regulator transcription factor [Spirochaetaceae bacterium]